MKKEEKNMKKMEVPQITNANLAVCGASIFAGLAMLGLETGTAVICEIPMCIDIMGSGTVAAI
ncbi:bacteriocin [Clostridium sp.]|uniref:bacteriocin n=1 Tax=Clostridium sp. TaxID=1506 RepID=UPI0039F53323